MIQLLGTVPPNRYGMQLHKGRAMKEGVIYGVYTNNDDLENPYNLIVKVKKETKNIQNQESRRLGLIESLHMQHHNLRRLKRYSIFKITRIGSMIPKEIKYNLHYDDVRGDFLRPPHGTTPATVEYNKVKKDCLWKQRTRKITKIGDSVWLSLFICNTVVCKAAYVRFCFFFFFFFFFFFVFFFFFFFFVCFFSINVYILQKPLIL